MVNAMKDSYPIRAGPGPPVSVWMLRFTHESSFVSKGVFMERFSICQKC